MANLAARRRRFFAICEKPEGGGADNPPPGRAWVKNEQRYRRETWETFSYNNMTSSVICFEIRREIFIFYG